MGIKFEPSQGSAATLDFNVEFNTEDGAVLVLQAHDWADGEEALDYYAANPGDIDQFFRMVDKAREAYRRHLADGGTVGLPE